MYYAVFCLFKVKFSINNVVKIITKTVKCLFLNE